ncbi:MAG: hypothetical protein Ct9H300mP18_10430 [Candidatus Neomarinimicrobiota bacterium]|nr:MAG: hypothetical protein Ct9H300mP18_10430 [Candidatus Neomarinimicrobiota bacterium]
MINLLIWIVDTWGINKMGKSIYSFEGLLEARYLACFNQVLGFNDRVPNYNINNTIYGLKGSHLLINGMSDSII